MRRAGIGAGVALLLFTVVGFFVVPPLARRVAQTQLTQALGRKVVIERIRVNPFALSAAVEGLHVFERDATTAFVDVRRFFVNAQLSSIWRRAPVVKEVSLDGLRVHVERRRATPGGWGDLTAYNFSDILAHLAPPPGAPPPPPRPAAPADGAPPRFSINNIRVTDGALVFDDRPLGSHHEISALTIGVPFVSTLPIFIDSFVEPGLSVRVDGTPFVVQGRSKPFKDSLETVLELRLDALDLTQYVPFVPLELPFTVDSARLTVALDVAFLRPKIDAPSLSVKGRVGLRDVTLREKRGAGAEPLPLLKLGRFDVAIGDANLTAQIFHVSEVRLAGLEVDVRRHAGGTLNLQRMIPQTPPAPPEERPTRSGGPRFTVQTIELKGIKLTFEDRTTTPVFRATVDDVSLAVNGLSNAPGKPATLQFEAKATPGGVIKQRGSLSLAPHLVATGNVGIDGLEPGRFAPYYASDVAFDITSGRLRLGTSYKVEQPPGRSAAVALEGAFVELADLALRRRDRREEPLRLTALGIHGASLDLGARKLNVAEVSLREGNVRAARDEKGTIDLTTLLAAPQAPAKVEPHASRDPRVSPRAGAAAAAAPSPTDSAGHPTEEAPWTVSVAKLDLDKWSVRFDDRAVRPRAVLAVDALSLHLTDVTTAPGGRMGVTLRMGINRKGSVAVTGAGGYQPLAASLRYELKSLDIVPFQPYFADLVNLTVTNGAVSLKGQATVEIPVPAPRGPARPPKVGVEADLQVADFACVDGVRKEPLVQWKSFRVSGVKATTSPAVRIAVADVGLDDLQARLTLLADGSTNLAHAFAAAPPVGAGAAARSPAAVASAPVRAAPSPARPAASAPASGPSSAAPQLDIGQVVLHRGAVAFSDRSIQPAFSADVTDLETRIRGLSSSADTQADVDLHAAINRAGSLSITGKANPVSKELFADIKVDVKDVELPPTSPYAGRYAGYLVDKGKLGVSLDYHVANRQLQASNHVVLDQFTFGAKTDSRDAVKVPVRLAVAILKDRHGVIDLDLPIAGSLDDPEFKIGRLILKVLGNLIVKAVTAPFSYIAAAFGGGEELSRLDFAAGSTALEVRTKQKLASLQKALTERPGLSFEIEGIADPKRDRESVRQQLIERQLATERLAELTAEAGDTGRPVPPLDSIRVSVTERARLVEKIYRTKGYGKPPRATTGPAPPPAPSSSPPSASDMEKALLDHATVSDDDLRTLALRRATLVQATLASAVPGSAARLFLVRPRLDPNGARVDFRLKPE